jgi:hypothetical protein
MLIIATNGSGVICTPSGRAPKASPLAARGAVLASGSAVTTGSFGVDEDGLGDLHGTSSPATGTCTVCPIRLRPAFTSARAKLRSSSALR